MRPPAHLRAAVRIMDRCGVDDAVVGDMLETYQAHPSTLRLWREVMMALVSRGLRHVRDNRPQTLRRLATLGAVAWLFVYLIPLSPHIDIASSVRVEDLSGGWFETDAGFGRTRLLPTVTFQLLLKGQPTELRVRAQVSAHIRVRPSPVLVEQVERICGPGAVSLR